MGLYSEYCSICDLFRPYRFKKGRYYQLLDYETKKKQKKNKLKINMDFLTMTDFNEI